MPKQADIIICGAGITGISAAYFLAKAGVKNILLLDERSPLSLTSDHSSECYRNWWPDAPMLELLNRSIDLMEELADESGNFFHLNRRGYLFVTADESKISALIERSERISKLGAGPLRTHTIEVSNYQPAPLEGFHDQPDGADLLLGNELIRQHYPYLTESAVAALHVRRAGWLSAQQLGMYLLESARRLGVQFETARVTNVAVNKGCVTGVQLGNGERIACSIFVNAAGPFLKEVGKMLSVDIPVYSELHIKATVKDVLGVIERGAPLLIWTDPQQLPWDEQERAFFAEDPETRWLTELFPSGIHTRPEGLGESQIVLMVWEYREHVVEPTFPIELDESYPDVALRGLSTMLPGLCDYFTHPPRPSMDGGYYTKTRENRPLIGPLPVKGAYVIGAVSGYGIMSACGAGELLAKHIVGQALPDYTSAFLLERYEDIAYLKHIDEWQDRGQL